MNNQKRYNVSMVFITCCMAGRLRRGLPFAASSSIELQQTKAANGIQLPANNNKK